MLLFLPDGVLSITTHGKETFNLKVRALSRDMITRYLDADVYYDSTEDLPYHATIFRPQLQELMFYMLEKMDYSSLPKAGNGTHYGTLLKQVHQAMNFYPVHEDEKKTVPEEPEIEVPEAAMAFASMVLGSVGGRGFTR